MIRPWKLEELVDALRIAETGPEADRLRRLSEALEAADAALTAAQVNYEALWAVRVKIRQACNAARRASPD